MVRNWCSQNEREINRNPHQKGAKKGVHGAKVSSKDVKIIKTNSGDIKNEARKG
jgi:hypothetical protein